MSDKVSGRVKWKRMAVLAALAASSTAAANTPERSFGVWSNPKGSVHVRAEPCGDRMCGLVVWANDKAKADAARGGSPQLVGVTLFRDFERRRPDVWRGRVFVPDISSEERSGGSGCVSRGRSRLSPDHKKKTNNIKS